LEDNIFAQFSQRESLGDLLGCSFSVVYSVGED